MRRPGSLAVLASIALAATLVPALTTAAQAKSAGSAKPVITSVQANVGSSVGYAHVIVRGRHLTGGTVTIAGRRVYAKVVSSKVIAAYPGGHRHGTRFKVVVTTKAGRSNVKRYEYRYARPPGALRVTAPAGSAADDSYSITRCGAVGTCVSLGVDGSAADRLVARVTTRGRTTVARIPLPAGATDDGTAYLADLSCPTATFCAAIGGYEADSGGLFSTWNGHTWTSQRLPAGDPSAYRNYSEVSCGSPTHCMALDDRDVYSYDAGTLTRASAALPAGRTGVRAYHVSCPSAGWCTVVGSADAKNTTVNFASVRQGTRWTTRLLANPARWKGNAPDLDGLDCAHSDRCTVLTGGGSASDLNFAVLHAGTTRYVPVALPADADRHAGWSVDNQSSRVSCPTSGTCWTLAAYTVRGVSKGRGYQPVAIRLRNGTSARVDALPRPVSSRTGAFEMNDLSCPTSNSCVAVGERGDTDVNDVHGDAVVETLSAGVWTPAAAPSPTGRPRYSGYEFTSVDCSAVARCTAVGDYNYDHNPDAEGDQPLEKTRPVILEVTAR